MENKKEPIKIRLSTVILIFIIFILIIAIVGILFYYNRKISDSNNNEIQPSNNIVTNEIEKETSNNSNDSKIEKIDINSDEVQKLYNEILKSNKIYGEENWNESFYKDEKVTYNELSNIEKNIAVLQSIEDSDTVSMDTKNVNKSKLYYKNDVGIASTAKVYSKQLIEARAKQLFGEQNQNIQWKTIDNNFGYIYDYVDEQYYAYGYQGGGFGCPVASYTNLIDGEKDKENIYLYDKFIFSESTPTNVYFYTSSSKANLIDQTNIYKELDEATVLDKYGEKAKKYKHTFKKDSDGNYYWYSTEPIE